MIDAVRDCERRRIPGAFAECGVWRGGSVLAMILTLQDIGSLDRDIYLFGTFEGMRQTLAATAYPATGLIFVKGRVEETIPAQAQGAEGER